MMYGEKKKAQLSMEDFVHPPAIYRGTPFWAWNCTMTEEKIKSVLKDFKTMGMGGAFLHSRTGMDMPYLGEEFMQMIRLANEEAKSLGLHVCLYDEDRWPSGYAGGLVTQNERYRSRFLVFSPRKLPLHEKADDMEYKASAEAVLNGKRRLLAAYRVQLKNGWLKQYSRLTAEEAGNGECNPKAETDLEGDGWKSWYAYLEIAGDNPWFNNQAYVDTLNPEAVREFIRITYEAYERELGADFGTCVPMIFTDEPQFAFKSQFGYAEEETYQKIPYTDDFEETYRNTYGESFLDYLPEIFWDLPENRVSVHRYRYHDHVCQRFTESYADQIGAWCKEHGIILTGHMMREPFLEWQTMALGEAMRSYRSFGIPGIDMLCDRRELTTAKQAQSAAHQFGAPGMTSEMYGVTNWDFDFRGHKLAGDWQAALGVTCRVHHLTWTSMAGEAKRDYPASIGHQSPWYEEYPYIEDYFARLNTVLTRGRPCVKVGVIHPIESYWLYWGTQEHTASVREEREENFTNLVKWLLYGLIDFDFISESLLADFKQEGREGFQAGAMCYDVVLVPDCMTLRRSTAERLLEFRKRGGRVIFAGRIPQYVDALPSGEVERMAAGCQVIRYTKQEVLRVLEENRVLEILDNQGKRTKNLIYQMREEGEERWLFVSHSEKPENPDLAGEEILYFSVHGIYEVEKYEPLSGGRQKWQVSYKDGKTCWKEISYEHDSFLYHLMPCSNPVQEEEIKTLPEDVKAECNQICIPTQMPVTFEEPNVLLLDRAEYRLDEGTWQEEEDILRIDNLVRGQLGMPLRMEAFAQPWVSVGKKETENMYPRLQFRFSIEADCEIDEVSLALETPECTQIRWNGVNVESLVTGWYVDYDIKTIKLGSVQKGTNILELGIPFDGLVQVENVYLLGDFGVYLRGRCARLVEPVKTIAFGDICIQGLPFYGGNLTYHIDLELSRPADSVEIQVSKFRASVIRGKIDGMDLGRIAFSPYILKTGPLEVGHHLLELTVFGNRVNTFGPLHNCDQTEIWIGPNAWRSTGTSWCYEYQLKPMGILISPQVRMNWSGR